MKLLHLAALLPFAIAAPATKQDAQSIPELSASQWSSIQSGFVANVRSLGSWSWSAAQELVQELENGGETGEERTIWQQLKADPHSFSKIVKLIEVCHYLFSFMSCGHSGTSADATVRRPCQGCSRQQGYADHFLREYTYLHVSDQSIGIG